MNDNKHLNFNRNSLTISTLHNSNNMEKMQSIDNQQINKRIMYEIYDRKEQLLLNQISKDAFNCTFSKLKNEHHENIVLEIYDEIPYLMEQPPF